MKMNGNPKLRMAAARSGSAASTLKMSSTTKEVPKISTPKSTPKGT